ncbi:MAG: EamA family transporter [Devosia sp.]
MLAHLQLFAVLLLSVYSQIMMKSRAANFSALPDSPSGYLNYLVGMALDWRVLSAACATFLAGVLWLLVIRTMELGYAFPFMAMSFVLIPIAAAIFLKEPFPPIQILGLILVVVGITISTVSR